jgi:hypothetical protein
LFFAAYENAIPEGVLTSIAESGTKLTAVAYLLDTNIFNQLVDARISFAELPNNGQFLATYLQIQELGNTKSQDRREVLLSKFQEVNPQTVPVSNKKEALRYASEMSKTSWDDARAEGLV